MSTKKETNDKRQLLTAIIDGSLFTKKWFLKQIPFIFLLTVLCIIYISNRYNAEQILRKTININKELKELRAEAITTTSKLMFKSKQSEVIKLVEQNNLGLKEAIEPPHKIIVKKDD